MKGGNTTNTVSPTRLVVWCFEVACTAIVCQLLYTGVVHASDRQLSLQHHNGYTRHSTTPASQYYLCVGRCTACGLLNILAGLGLSPSH